MDFSLRKSMDATIPVLRLHCLVEAFQIPLSWMGSIESKGGALVRESTINGGFLKHMQYELHSYEVLALSGRLRRTPDTVSFDQ